jgi:hypothetical protein
MRLTATYEGLLLIINDKIQSDLLVPGNPKLNLETANSSTTLLATTEYVKQFLVELNVKLFVQTWLQICAMQTSRYHMFRAMQSTNPTVVARTLLQKDNIIAKQVGDGILHVWECAQISEYFLRNVDSCYNGIPISYTLNNHTIDAFIDIPSRSITHRASKSKCSSISTQYIMGYNFTKILVWDGRVLKPASMSPQIVDLSVPIPVIQNIHITQGKINDPYHEAIESLAAAQQTSQNMNNVIKLLNAQLAGIDGADSRAVAVAAEETGVHVDNFFSSLAHGLEGLLPSPWIIILVLISAIMLFLAILVLSKKCGDKSHHITPNNDRLKVINDLRARYTAKTNKVTIEHDVNDDK